MARFEPKDSSDVARLVDSYPLCWVISGEGAERYATPLPLLAETREDGSVAALFGHIARSNPQQKALEKEPRATILYMGPQGYISPGLVSNPTWGPTWNYAVCRFETVIEFVPDETESAVWRLAARLEGTAPDSWTPERMGERVPELLKRIVAFRAKVLEVHARFKLGQDESNVIFDEIVEGHADHTLADWMKRSRP